MPKCTYNRSCNARIVRWLHSYGWVCDAHRRLVEPIYAVIVR